MHLKCVIVIFNNTYLAYKFLCDFIEYSTRSPLSEKFLINGTTAPSSKLYSYKLYQYHLSKYLYRIQSIIRFHAVESKIELTQIFCEKRNRRATYRAVCTQITSLLFPIIYILCIKFCAILSIDTEISVSQKFRKT